MSFRELVTLFLCFLLSESKESNKTEVVNKNRPAQEKPNLVTEKIIPLNSSTATENSSTKPKQIETKFWNVLATPFGSTTEYVFKYKTSTEYLQVSRQELDSEVVKVKHRLIPDLDTLGPALHKGTCGRIGVFGGTELYSGAPYFSAMSALRSGIDLAYIFTTPGAAPSIKSYSPEFMVLPYLDAHIDMWVLIPWLIKVDVIILGPGLGTNAGIYDMICRVINILKSELDAKARPIIIDADGISFFMNNHQVFNNYPGHVYLTPNEAEFNKLTNKILNSTLVGDKPALRMLAEALGPKFTIVLKGWKDLIANEKMMISCEIEGSPRRCGGQGDLLGGVLGAFSYWIAERKKRHEAQLNHLYTIEMIAAYSACSVIRTSNQRAFERKGRSMLATDMLKEIPAVLDKLFQQ